MDLKLRVTQGKNVGQEVAIPGKKFLIGRAEDCNLRPGSDLISRHHCVIIVEDGYLAVRDFGSKNGTGVNGESVIGERELKHGDQLRVGPLEFEVIITQGALSGKKKPPVHDAKEAAARTAATPVDDGDVDRWLSEPTAITPQATTDTQLVRVGDTDEIDIGSTREFSLEPLEPVTQPVPQAASAPSAPSAPASPTKPAAAAVKPAAPASTPAAPAIKPAAVSSAPAAAKPVVAPKPAAAPQPVAVAATARPAVAPSPAAVPQPVAETPKPAAPRKPATPAPAPFVPEPMAAEPEAAVPPPAAEKRGLFGGIKKTFGKLPQQKAEESKDSRDAAADMLSKFRKRR